MTRFADELIGSEGERCKVGDAPAIIREVHDNGKNVTVQYVEDNNCRVVHFSQVELLDPEVN